MTAIVGFMNKHGVAVAADSAVTLGNTHKVVNSGNKIFTLSKYAPVGIATYGNASFMETPWEIIVKLFRKRLGKNKFNTLDEYISSFVEYLHNEEFFLDEDIKKQILLQRAIAFYNCSVTHSQEYNGYDENDASRFLSEELRNCMQLNSNDEESRFCEMQTYNYEAFYEYFRESYMSNIQRMPLLINAEQQELFLHSFYQYIRVYVEFESDSGLVFFGYGEKEIYPSMINVVVADSFNGRLRYKRLEYNSGRITVGGSTAWVIPYAQIDVAQTIIRGINPSFLEVLRGSMIDVLDGYRQNLVSMIPANEQTQNALNAIKAINHKDVAQTFVDYATGEFRKFYTNPLINTVARLSKEDMANLAESLVELTSLIRRMTPKEETVGGPVDVAIVSKGDGFIWLKRKHYFDLKLNANFLNTYNDEE